MTKRTILISFIGITLIFISIYSYYYNKVSGKNSCGETGGEWGIVYARNGCSKATPPITKLGRMGIDIFLKNVKSSGNGPICTQALVPYEGCKCKDGTYWGSYEEGCISMNKNSLR